MSDCRLLLTTSSSSQTYPLLFLGNNIAALKGKKRSTCSLKKPTHWIKIENCSINKRYLYYFFFIHFIQLNQQLKGSTRSRATNGHTSWLSPLFGMFKKVTRFSLSLTFSSSSSSSLHIKKQVSANWSLCICCGRHTS